ncbi:MAG: NAD(P)/FAD-dependent oxidoreductase [Sphingopyxis sp.]|uniref:FAD-dependent oxidoreductase n=1 Tax=Sphingopyxis sp. TaxID=1908224 RepID=UPI002AB8B495|nr:NAD(P)/FAD-dependent oxidoreductase [Sphingopyxis sp.]MDZ3832084.1 NAD(P)/FAD-dependent oxidoreductase [Sphingopyxis sp.]
MIAVATDRPALDIAVAGCGPCGLATALLLRRAGHRVTLFERFEAARPIGSGLMLQPTGMAVLARLGLLDAVLAAGARIDRLFGKEGDRVVLDVHYAALRGRAAFGVGIHRATLFSILHVAVLSEDVAVETDHLLTGSRLVGQRRALCFEGRPDSRPFDLVVDALGSRTPLAPPTGRELAYGALWASLDWPDAGPFDSHVLEQRYSRASMMVGVLPIGKLPQSDRAKAAFFWSLRADRLDHWRRGGIDAWKGQVAALWPSCAPMLSQIESPDQLTFARYAHRTLAAPAEPALIHIGDAWHSASPQLGQGANMALLDAWALCVGLAEGVSVADGIARAIALRRRHVRVYQWLTALFTPVYQSDSRLLPMIRNRLVGPLSRLWPATRIQAALVSGLVADPLTPLGLAAWPVPPPTPRG